MTWLDKLKVGDEVGEFVQTGICEVGVLGRVERRLKASIEVNGRLYRLRDGFAKTGDAWHMGRIVSTSDESWKKSFHQAKVDRVRKRIITSLGKCHDLKLLNEVFAMLKKEGHEIHG